MCGIVAYIGDKQAYPILLNGLKRLEYRGYDSAGVALIENGNLNVYKRKGKVSALESFVDGNDLNGTIGIGHTRWATHGLPTDANAHPHLSENEEIVLIHNGILENYSTLKEELINRGYTFKSETDTEVLVQFISEVKKSGNLSLFEAVRIVLNEIVGAYAIVVMDRNNPDQLIAAKNSSPLVIGIGHDNDFFVASDATPIIEHTQNVVYLEDEEIAIIDRHSGFKLKNIKNQEQHPVVQELSMQLETLEKGGYDHFMLKEIFEQPKSVRDSMRGRLNLKKGVISLGGIKDFEKKLVNAKRIVITACGTSWHAGLVGEYLFESLARIPVEVEYASEFRYRNPIITQDDIVIAISQSGETADTLAAIKMAKEKGATILGICNVIGSTIPRETDAGSYTHAGPEIGVASTKAFTAQVTVLTLMAMMVGYKNGSISLSDYHRMMLELDQIPAKIEKVLQQNERIKEIASIYKDHHNALYLGRGFEFPVALEGALKLKEISYIHAEGYPAAEMKHGPIALIDEEMPVIVMASKGPLYEKLVSNIQEVKARQGKIMAVVTEGDTQVKAIADHVIEIPQTNEFLTPLISVIPLQLLSYHIAVMRNCNVDQPRNLAKSVTVE
jgi:glucosamine--fructose-6-phosphate aminotransferase (isomerizing)